MVVVQNGKHALAGKRHIDVVVGRNGRILLRRNAQRKACFRFGDAVADRYRNRKRTVCVLCRRDTDAAGTVPVVDQHDAVRRNHRGVAAFARQQQRARRRFLIAYREGHCGKRGILVGRIIAFFKRDHGRVVLRCGPERAFAGGGQHTVRRLIGKTVFAFIVRRRRIAERVAAGLLERANARRAQYPVKREHVAVAVRIVADEKCDRNVNIRLVLVIGHRIVFGHRRVVDIDDMYRDRLLNGRKPIAKRQHQRDVPADVSRRAEQHRHFGGIVTKAGNRNPGRRKQSRVRRSRLEHHAVRGRFDVVDLKRQRCIPAVLVDGDFRRQVHEIRSVRRGRNTHRYTRFCGRSRRVLYRISKGIVSVEVAVRRIANLPVFQNRAAVQAVFAARQGDRFSCGNLRVDVRVVGKHVNQDASVLGYSRFVVRSIRRVVNVVYRDRNHRGRRAAVAVRGRVTKLVRTGVVFRRRIFDLPEYDHRRTVRRLRNGIDAQFVPVGRIGIVGEHVNSDFRILVCHVTGVVHGQRRVVDWDDVDCERIAGAFARLVRDRNRDRDRSAETVRRRRNIQACFPGGLLNRHLRKQFLIACRRFDRQVFQRRFRVRNVQHDMQGLVLVDGNVRNVAQHRRGAQRRGAQRIIARAVGKIDRVGSAAGNGKRPAGKIRAACVKKRRVLFAFGITRHGNAAAAAVCIIDADRTASAGGRLRNAVYDRRGCIDVNSRVRTRGNVARLVAHRDVDAIRPVFSKRIAVRKRLPFTAVDAVDIELRRCSGIPRKLRHLQRYVRAAPSIMRKRNGRGSVRHVHVDVGDSDIAFGGRFTRVIFAVGCKMRAVFTDFKRVGRGRRDFRAVVVDPFQPAVAVRRGNGDRKRLIRPVRVVFDRTARRGRIVDLHAGVGENDGIVAGSARAVQVDKNNARIRRDRRSGRQCDRAGNTRVTFVQPYGVDGRIAVRPGTEENIDVWYVVFRTVRSLIRHARGNGKIDLQTPKVNRGRNIVSILI